MDWTPLIGIAVLAAFVVLIFWPRRRHNKDEPESGTSASGEGFPSGRSDSSSAGSDGGDGGGGD